MTWCFLGMHSGKRFQTGPRFGSGGAALKWGAHGSPSSMALLLSAVEGKGGNQAPHPAGSCFLC